MRRGAGRGEMQPPGGEAAPRRGSQPPRGRPIAPDGPDACALAAIGRRPEATRRPRTCDPSPLPLRWHALGDRRGRGTGRLDVLSAAEGFRPSLLVVTLLALHGVARIVDVSRTPDANAMGHLVRVLLSLGVDMLFAGLITVVVGWIAYRFSGRSRAAGNRVMTFVLVLFILIDVSALFVHGDAPGAKASHHEVTP